MINKMDIDKAFEFYNIDNLYKRKCYKCAEEINKNEYYTKALERVYEVLYCNDFSTIKELWNIKDINKLFAKNINPFVTNLMIILGYKFHKNNMNRYRFDFNQINIHKIRVKECFENDLIIRGYEGVRISQMLWAIYFIRGKLIEIGRLQYEYFIDERNMVIIKIHIPKGSKLDINDVKKSIYDSKYILEKIYDIKNFKYLCNSWLLSNQIYEIVDKSSNIAKFHDLFSVTDGIECTADILNFVYNINECNNYMMLQEDTSLQKNIKKQLLDNKKFYLGIGTLIPSSTKKNI